MDDAVISCWYTIAVQGANVLTVFARIPDNNHATLWDKLCGESNSIQMVNLRRKENKKVLNELGKEANYLDLLDIQYRKNNPTLSTLKQRLFNYIDMNTIMYFPLAGSFLYKHPDHVLLRELGVSLLNEGYKVSFYPDIPYMSMPKKVSKKYLSKLNNRASKLLNTDVTIEVNLLNKDQLKDKQTSCHGYISQYRMTNLVSFNNLNRQLERNYEIIIRTF